MKVRGGDGVRLAAAALLGMTLAGCEYYHHYFDSIDDKLQARIGTPVDDVISQWGAPRDVIPLSDRRRVYEWVKYTPDCTMRLTADSKGKVETWAYEGGECYLMPLK